MLRDAQPVAPEVLAIIPARGGSRGIVRKNVQMLGDKPLVAWSVVMACAARNIDRVVVSTDDTEIAAIAREYGAEVPFLRPANISGDKATVSEALSQVRNTLYREEGYCPTHQAIFYPTHPFRKLPTVEMLVDRLLEGYETVSTVKRIDSSRERFFYEKDGILTPYGGNRVIPYVRMYGYFVGGFLDFSAAGNYQLVLKDEVELIDIDTPEDLALAREVVRNKLFDFEL